MLLINLKKNNKFKEIILQKVLLMDVKFLEKNIILQDSYKFKCNFFIGEKVFFILKISIIILS